MSQEGRQYSREQRVLVIRHAGKSKKHKSIKIHASAGVANALPLVSTQPNATGFRSAPPRPVPGCRPAIAVTCPQCA